MPAGGTRLHRDGHRHVLDSDGLSDLLRSGRDRTAAALQVFAHALKGVMPRKRGDWMHEGKRTTAIYYRVPDPAAALVDFAIEKSLRRYLKGFCALSASSIECFWPHRGRDLPPPSCLFRKDLPF